MSKIAKIIVGIFVFSICTSTFIQNNSNVNAVVVNESFESDSEFLTYVSDFQTPNIIKENPSVDNDYRYILDPLTMQKMPELTGIFPATYTFTEYSDALSYQMPSGWVDANNHQTGQNVNITDWLDHDNVIGCWDTHTDNSINLEHTISQTWDILTVSFWYYCNTIPTTKTQITYFKTSSGSICLFLLAAEVSGLHYVQTVTGGVWTNRFQIVEGQWMYFNITINCITDKFTCDLNNVRQGEYNLHADGNYANVQKIYMGTSDTNVNPILTYYDAIEFSTDCNPAENQVSTEEYDYDTPFFPLAFSTQNEDTGEIDYLQRTYVIAQFSLHNISLESYELISVGYGIILKGGEDPKVFLLALMVYPDKSFMLYIYSDHFSVQETLTVDDIDWINLEVNLHAFITNTQRYGFKVECRVNQTIGKTYSVEYLLEESSTNSEDYFYPYFFGSQVDSNELSVENPLDSARLLKTIDNIPVSSFSDVGYIEQDIFVPEYPDPNAGRLYWIYLTWVIAEDEQDEVIVGNEVFGYTYEFNIIRSELAQSFYYYNPQTIVSASWGDWGLFNWVRDLIVTFLNVIVVLFNFLFYLVVYALNFLFMGFIMNAIVPFFWNFLIFWLMYALHSAFCLIVGGIILAGQFLPELILGVITVVSYVAAALIWVLTLGTIPFETVLETVTSFNGAIATFFTETLYTFFDALPFFFGYAAFYFVLLGFAYVKYIYAKSRGWVNRAAQLESVFNSYLEVIKVGKNIMSEVKNLFVGWI
jgi:hypothetical protein